MSRYGVDYYGRGYYGNIALANYDATPFTVTPIDYGKVHLVWNTPVGNWTGLRLVRNSFGFPETADDGVVLLDQFKGSLSGATSTEFYDPVGVSTSSNPPISATKDVTITHSKQRNIVSWSLSGKNLSILVTDATYIAAGSSISVYGGTAIDGSYTVTQVGLTPGNPFPITYTIQCTLTTSYSPVSGTSGILLLNQLEQEHFYYYSIFLKTLSNTVPVSGAVANVDGTVTYTTSSQHTFAVGSLVGVTGFSPAAFNISGFQVIAKTNYTFTVVSTATGTATITGTAVAGLNTTWVRAGNAAGLSVKNYGSQALMYDYLPNIYKIVDEQQSIENQENEQLRAFLGIFGFYYDVLKTFNTLAANRYDMRRVSANLLPAVLQQFNLIYEPELGFKRMRSLLANISNIYSNKGSYQSTVDYIKAYTGLNCSINQGKNLFLDSDSSSFEQGIGLWATPANATLTAGIGCPITSWNANGTTITLNVNYSSLSNISFTTGMSIRLNGTNGIDNAYTTGVVVAATTSTVFKSTSAVITITTGTNYSLTTGTTGTVYPYTILPYSESSNPYGKSNLQNGVGVIKCTTAGTITTSCGGSDLVQTGIPVTAGTKYVFSFKAYSNTTTRSFTANIKWYDYRGNLLSTSTGSGTTSSNSAWTTVSAATTAPANAFFASPGISIASAALNEVHYIDACQLEVGTSAGYYQDARQLQVFVLANRVNELINPGFDSQTTAPWSVTGGTISIAVGESVPTASSNLSNSAYSGEVYASGTTAVEVRSCAVSDTSNYISVLSGTSYTFSGYFTMSADGNPAINQQITLNIDWYDSTKTFIRTSTSPVETVNLNASGYSRFFVTGNAPENCSYAIARWEWAAPTAANYGILFDETMFEAQPAALDFFNGSYGYADQNDLIWQGTPGLSRSHYYRNRTATYNRLNSTLANFLPYGSNYAIYYAAL